MVLMMLIAISAFSQQKEIAQNDRAQRGEMMKMSAQERATISSKKMALKLDLTEAQRVEIEKLHLQRAREVENLMAERQKLSNKNREKRFSRTNANLDKQLEHQEKMKSILTEEQFNKWKKSQENPARKKMDRKKKKF
ncbi:hypothetical protein BH23BAC2_BH23BAC2_25520 [soil metagenome]